MKIWCLNCGKVLDKTAECETKLVHCPVCGEAISYSVKNREAVIACLNQRPGQNSMLRVVNTSRA